MLWYKLGVFRSFFFLYKNNNGMSFLIYDFFFCFIDLILDDFLFFDFIQNLDEMVLFMFLLVVNLLIYEEVIFFVVDCLLSFCSESIVGLISLDGSYFLMF